MQKKTAKKLLKVREVSQMYGMSEAYWRKLIQYRKIPFIKLDYAVRLSTEDIEKFLEANRIDDTHGGRK